MRRTRPRTEAVLQQHVRTKKERKEKKKKKKKTRKQNKASCYSNTTSSAAFKGVKSNDHGKDGGWLPDCHVG